MERCCCCRFWEFHSYRLKLLVTFREHKFVARLHRDISCSESIQALNVLVKELFPEESDDIHSLSLDGYVLPGKYLIGNVCESGGKVEAQVEAKVEGKKQKRPAAVPQTEPTKKSKRSDEVTPAPKVKFSSLFQASEMKGEDKPSDSDSDDSAFHDKKETKQRVNVFRKTT